MLESNNLNRIRRQGHIIFKSRFLKNLSKVERYEFLQLCHRRTYKKGEYIYHQNDPGTGMYFIEDGRVQLIAESGSDSEKYTHTLKPPQSFGVLSIGYEFRRFATARCISECTLLGFFQPDFETLKKRQPRIAVKFMETLARVAMGQLSIAIDELREYSDARRIIALQFDAYTDKP